MTEPWKINQLGIKFLAFLAGSSLSLGALGGELSTANSVTSVHQPESAEGLTFDQVNFPIEPVTGEIKLAARGGWVWDEGQTHRIVLDHDVDVTLAQYRFRAASANLWIRKLSSDPEKQTTRYQVYAIFEDMKSADGSITMKAQQLPVRGVIEVSEAISMALDARFDGAPKSKSVTASFVDRTNAIYAQRVLGAPIPEIEQPPSRPWSSGYAQGEPKQGDQATHTPGTKDQQETPQAEASHAPIFHPSGVFSVAIGGRIVIDNAIAGTGATITADGGVTIQYEDPANNQSIDFKAERVVIYTAGDEPISGVSRLGTDQIEGIYLEGGVFAGDDQWSIRSPRMYLDVAHNKALMLDAVFWTTDQKTAMPLYLRAKSVRQVARDEFIAKKAKMSNSAFFEPDLTIGVSDIQITIDEPATTAINTDKKPPSGVRVVGKSVTLKVGSVPVLWLPGFKGDASSFPLRQVTIEDTNRSGTAIKTRWNALSLFKIDAPPGVQLDLDQDYYADRGAAIGLRGNWVTSKHRGGLFAYLLANDNGTDITSAGKRINRDGDTRGMILFHDIWRFTDAWTLVSERSFISDEAFIPALFDRIGRTSEDLRNRFQLERLKEDSYFALEIRSPINDFIAVEHLLQSPGYQVSKLPEARFVSLGKDLLANVKPGLLTYSFEARAGVLRLNFSEVNAKNYGFTTNSLADDAFGTTANSSLGDKFRALGLDESPVTRLDTRHELRGRFDLGPVRVVPFAVGRITAYDDSFGAFSPGQTDDLRYWGGAGITFSTTFSKINEGAENRFFDIHRLRHIIEPSITIWGGDSNFNAGDVPIFDDDVEGLLVGTAFRAAIDQTWQTKRGGIGRWRDVDVLKIRSEYVNTSNRAGQSKIPDFFSARPELSNPGEYLSTSAVWKATEVLAFAGEMVYDLDAQGTARASIGTIIQHQPGFSTTIEYREIQPLNATFASFTSRYRLSDKYAVNGGVNYNFDLNDFQTFNAQVLRRFQIGSLGATVQFDNIRGVTSFGFVFRPFGSGSDLPVNTSWGG